MHKAKRKSLDEFIISFAMGFLSTYKDKYHVSVNFYSVFLLVTFIPDLIGIVPGAIVYPFWALKAGLAVWVIINYRRKLYQLSRLEKLFLFTALVYFINIAIDVFLQNYPTGMGSAIDLVGFSLSILIAFSFRYDAAFGSNKSYNFLVVTLAIGLFMAYFLAKESSNEALAGRFDANSTVNMINYGQMGCALSLLSIYGFVNKRIRFGKIIFTALFFLGVVSIIKAGTRSPVVVLIMVTVFYFLSRSGFAKGLIVTSLALVGLWLSLGFLSELSEDLGSSLSERLVSAVENRETSGRDKIYGNTLDIIGDAPLFGDFYLIPSGPGKEGYPHNFFLEAFMTTGIIGGIPFAIMVLIILYKSYQLLQQKRRSGWIVLMFLQVLVYGMFSSSLYSSQDFWALCLFMLSIPSAEAVVAKKPRIASLASAQSI